MTIETMAVAVLFVFDGLLPLAQVTGAMRDALRSERLAVASCFPTWRGLRAWSQKQNLPHAVN